MTHVDESSNDALKRFLRDRRLRRYERIGAYVLICIIGSAGFYRIEVTNQLRCDDVAKSQEFDRGQVLALYDLGISAITPPLDRQGNPRPYTKQELQAIDKYKKNLNKYRDSQLARIQTYESCEGYEEE